jgi:hypothetical protein
MNAEVVLSTSQEVGSSGIVNVLTVKHGSFGDNSEGAFQVKYEHVGVGNLRPPKVMDGYVFAILFFAMQGAKRIVVEGPISDLAIRNAWSLGEAWHNLFPSIYQPVNVVSEQIITIPLITHQLGTNLNAGAVATFSGGVDSMFTALRHTDGSLGSGSYPLSNLVMVQGFDVSLDNQSAFDELTQRTTGFVKSLGLRRRIVKTNLKIVVKQNWEHSHGAQLASVLHQFSEEFQCGVIASTEPYSLPNPFWGSQPALDYLFSGSNFRIIHDGAGYTRTEKVEFLSKNTKARRSVKVCWEGSLQGRNCGVCEKCVRTKLNFLAVGVNKPECFDEELTVENILSVKVRNMTQFNELSSVLHYVDDKHRSDTRFEALRDLLERLKLTQQRDELSQQHDELIQQRDELIQQRDELIQQRDELIQQRDALLGSTIWRLTKPLRDLINFFRK